MRKEIIVLLALLFVLASCSGGDTKVVSNQKSFLGGTEGLTIAFVDGEPPESVTDGGSSPFTVSVKLENKGEAEIPKEDITLTLKGFDSGDFDVTPASLSVKPGEDVFKNDINPDTGAAIASPPVYVTIPKTGQLNFKNSLSGNSVFPFMVDVCYDYSTKATSQLCIKEDLIDSQDTDLCTVSGVKEVQNSGGPVQVSNFEEFTAGPEKVTFTFTVKDGLSGELSKQNIACNDDPGNEDYVKLTIDAGITGLTCSGLSSGVASGTAYTGEVRLAGGERQVRCTQPVPTAQRTDKIKIVDILVEYGYKESIRKDVLVKHISTE